MKIFKRIIMWILIVVTGFFGIWVVAGYVLSAPGYNGPKSDHFNGTTFQNPDGVKAKGIKEALKWMATRKQGTWNAILKNIEQEKPVERIGGSELKVTFINHASFLIQIGGLNILTDPIWSERTSPVNFAGPKRHAPPGIRFEDLPPIDVVVISHNHYDHLDVTTVKRLQKEHSPLFFVPLGISDFLEELGVENTTDMDWWQETAISDDLRLVCVPAQHFSGRGVFDRDKTLWAGFVIKASGGNIYFAGDTGYGKFFETIGEKYGPFRLSFLPIGAYKPSWFMSPIHISPREAVRVHRDVQSQKSIAMHFGTFPLADDGMEAPVDDLEKAIDLHGLPEEEFIALKNGETIAIR